MTLVITPDERKALRRLEAIATMAWIEWLAYLNLSWPDDTVSVDVWRKTYEGTPPPTECTYVHFIEWGSEWPYTTIGYIWHKPDLSDLEEPYLSAVKDARRKKEKGE